MTAHNLKACCSRSMPLEWRSRSTRRRARWARRRVGAAPGARASAASSSAGARRDRLPRLVASPVQIYPLAMSNDVDNGDRQSTKPAAASVETPDILLATDWDPDMEGGCCRPSGPSCPLATTASILCLAPRDVRCARLRRLLRLRHPGSGCSAHTADTAVSPTSLPRGRLHPLQRAPEWLRRPPHSTKERRLRRRPCAQPI